MPLPEQEMHLQDGLRMELQESKLLGKAKEENNAECKQKCQS